MALYLEVPYEQKDIVKALGAKWDTEKKKWKVTDKYQYYKFLDWIPYIKDDYSTIICDCIYIVETTHKCFKCKKETKVVCLGYQSNWFLHYKNEHFVEIEYSDQAIVLAKIPDELEDERFKTLLKDRFGVEYSYSETIKDYYCYYANHCQHCGVIQSNYSLYEKLDSPFITHGYNRNRIYKAYRVELCEDMISIFCEIKNVTYEITGCVDADKVEIEDITSFKVSLIDL